MVEAGLCLCLVEKDVGENDSPCSAVGIFEGHGPDLDSCLHLVEKGLSEENRPHFVVGSSKVLVLELDLCFHLGAYIGDKKNGP